MTWDDLYHQKELDENLSQSIMKEMLRIFMIAKT